MTTVTKPAWQSPVVLVTVGILVVGVVVIALLAMTTIRPTGTSAPVIDAAAPPVELRDGRTLGSASAPVKMEVWEDPQCSVCGNWSRDIEPLLIASFVKDGTVQLTYRDLMLGYGPESYDAAAAMRVAGALADKFWDMHSLVFANQGGVNKGSFSRDRLTAMAEKLGLDRDVFIRGLDDPAHRAAIDEESAQGSALGIHSTPTLIINGAMSAGLPSWEQLSDQIRASAASATAAPVGSGTPGSTAAPGSAAPGSAAPAASSGD